MHFPDHLDGKQAVAVVCLLEQILAEIWKLYGHEMAGLLTAASRSPARCGSVLHDRRSGYNPDDDIDF